MEEKDEKDECDKVINTNESSLPAVLNKLENHVEDEQDTIIIDETMQDEAHSKMIVDDQPGCSVLCTSKIPTEPSREYYCDDDSMQPMSNELVPLIDRLEEDKNNFPHETPPKTGTKCRFFTKATLVASKVKESAVRDTPTVIPTNSGDMITARPNGKFLDPLAATKIMESIERELKRHPDYNPNASLDSINSGDSQKTLRNLNLATLEPEGRTSPDWDCSEFEQIYEVETPRSSVIQNLDEEETMCPKKKLYRKAIMKSSYNSYKRNTSPVQVNPKKKKLECDIDPEHLNQMLAMGFERWKCLEALLSHDILEDAINYVLTHFPQTPTYDQWVLPEPQYSPAFASNSTASTTPAGLNITSSRASNTPGGSSLLPAKRPITSTPSSEASSLYPASTSTSDVSFNPADSSTSATDFSLNPADSSIIPADSSTDPADAGSDPADLSCDVIKPSTSTNFSGGNLDFLPTGRISSTPSPAGSSSDRTLPSSPARCGYLLSLPISISPIRAGSNASMDWSAGNIHDTSSGSVPPSELSNQDILEEFGDIRIRLDISCAGPENNYRSSLDQSLNASRQLFYLLSVSPAKDVVKFKEALDEDSFTWTPTLADVLLIFLNWGTTLEYLHIIDLMTEEDIKSLQNAALDIRRNRLPLTLDQMFESPVRNTDQESEEMKNIPSESNIKAVLCALSQRSSSSQDLSDREKMIVVKLLIFLAVNQEEFKTNFVFETIARLISSFSSEWTNDMAASISRLLSLGDFTIEEATFVCCVVLNLTSYKLLTLGFHASCSVLQHRFGLMQFGGQPSLGFFTALPIPKYLFKRFELHDVFNLVQLLETVFMRLIPLNHQISKKEVLALKNWTLAVREALSQPPHYFNRETGELRERLARLTSAVMSYILKNFRLNLGDNECCDNDANVIVID